MATASVTNTFVAGTAAEAAEVNTNFTNLVTFLNNSVVHQDGSKAMTANFDAGSNKIVNLTAGTADTDAVNKAQLDAAATTGAWTSYTPQIDQGASTDIAKTVNYSKYARYGRTIHYSFTLTLTAGGTAGSNVTVSIPVSASSTTALTGTAIIFDSSTNTSYACVIGAATAGGPLFFRHDGSGSGAWGQSPNLAIGSGDTIYGTITYEAAS